MDVTLSKIADVVSITAGLMTIIGVSGFLSWSFFKKSKTDLADSSISIFALSFKSGLCLLLLWVYAIPFFMLHVFIVGTLGKGYIGGADLFWGNVDWYAYIVSYLIAILIWLPFYILTCASVYSSSFKPFKIFFNRI